MDIFLAGQTNFGNRGCEALVRGTAAMVRQKVHDGRLLCPLDDVERDGRQWPHAESMGVRLVPGPRFPGRIRWWARANRILPLERLGLPLFALDADTRNLLERSSALIMTGGDIITLDYGVMSVYQWSRFVENAVDMGVPAVLWAASVGPFSARPGIEKVMTRHLRRYAAITVRETTSLAYLRSIGVDDACLVADPAFHLTPEPFETGEWLPSGRDTLGLNFSPLIRKFRPDEASAAAMDREIVAFVNKVLQETSLGVLLVPHVGPLGGAATNSDWHYMKSLTDALSGAGGRVRLAPNTLNAAQLKHLLAQCRYFIGARTHATIAALSQGVPTISIAYSTKAKGINQDLFGDTRYVLETPRVGADSLASALGLLQRDEREIRAMLADLVPQWRERALGSVDVLRRVARQLPTRAAA